MTGHGILDRVVEENSVLRARESYRGTSKRVPSTARTAGHNGALSAESFGAQITQKCQANTDLISCTSEYTKRTLKHMVKDAPLKRMKLCVVAINRLFCSCLPASEPCSPRSSLYFIINECSYFYFLTNHWEPLFNVYNRLRLLFKEVVYVRQQYVPTVPYTVYSMCTVD